MSVQQPTDPNDNPGPGMKKPAGAKQSRISVPDITARKGQAPLVCLTAYTTSMAQRLDPYVDLLLVGDSVGMVLYGFESTLPVTLDMMCQHGAAVRRGSAHALIVVDLPLAAIRRVRNKHSAAAPG